MFWADSSGVWATWHLADGNLDPAESVNPRLVQAHDPSLHGATYPVAAVSDGDIIAWCREHLARYKVPKTVVFGELPKTSTGKVQKYVLRERAKSL